MPPFTVVPLILLFPILGLLINLTLGSRRDERWIGRVACSAVAASFAVAVTMLDTLLREPQGGEVMLWEWLRIGTLTIPVALKVDALATTMSLVVTGVGTLIHIYAIGYMGGDPRFRSFFIYLNLFVAAMLVLADNYLLLFIGWELVGLCSYLLIGFWFEDLNNVVAARKAFIVNRVGDVAFLWGLILIFWTFDSLRYAEVFSNAKATFRAGAPVVTAITLLLFMGVTGKSAQIPLFIWLPDAMAGPTPVSALIHAATMVTAGVYLIARSQALFDLAPLTQSIIAWTGGVTALFAATIAIAQWDMKKVMAYSTISQLGYMIAAVGLGGYIAGLFHLIIHAFFKALLFLSAGSVMHGCGNEGDMRRLGGLRRAMPITFATFIIGGLGLAGVPAFAGFWSKDGIIAEASRKDLGVFVLLLVATGVTAFYIFRQLYLVFAGEQRSRAYHPHESPRVMTGPLIALAMLVGVGGILNAPPIHLLTRFLGGEAPPFEMNVAAASVGLTAAGWAAAWALYGRRPLLAGEADPLGRVLGRLYRVLERKYFVDELYGVWIVRPYQALTQVFGALDQRLVDPGIDRTAALSGDLARWLSLAQSGYVR